MEMAGFYVGLALLGLFLIGTIVYMWMSGRRPGMRDLDGGSDGTRGEDMAHQADLYEKPHHEQHKHHDQHDHH